MRAGILALPEDRRVVDAIARLALQRTIFYTPSEWADIGRLWPGFATCPPYIPLYSTPQGRSLIMH
jgi:hypothetical protein